MRILISSFAVLLSILSSANATDVIGDYGGWNVFRSDDECGLSMEFEGPGATEFTLLKYSDGRIGTLISNANWTAKDDLSYEITYILNDKSYSGNAIGSHGPSKAGLIAFMKPKFGIDFGQGSDLYVYLGDQKIDQLSLAGTAVAMKAVDRCLVKVRADLAERERERARFADIPEDPFVHAKPIVTAELLVPRPVRQAYWASAIARNYPSRALREEKSGRVGFIVTVGPTGRVSECEISQSSGHVVLDQAACRGMQRYARFHPALDEHGSPTSGQWSSSINYDLSKPSEKMAPRVGFEPTTK